MNNRGIPRYLGQQNIVRRLVINRIPGQQQQILQPRQLAVVAPAGFSYQPNMYPAPQLVQAPQHGLMPYAPRPRLSYPPPMAAPQFISPPAPAPAPVAPASVTMAQDSDYLQYNDPVIDDFQYNQQQILLVDSNNYSQYEEQTYQQQSYGQTVRPALQ